MDENLMLSDGDKVELYKTEQERYKTLITEVVSEKMYLVPVPTVKMQPMHINEGEIIYLTYFRDRGRYVMETVARSLVKREELRYVVLEQLKEPSPKQLREFFRLPVDVMVKVSKLVNKPGGESTSGADADDDLETAEIETISANDLSLTGLSITSELEYKSGERFMLTIYFNDKKTNLPPLTMFSESMRVVVDDFGMYRVGMKFVGLTNSMSDQLAKYLLAVQQKQIIRKRLIEGN